MRLLTLAGYVTTQELLDLKGGKGDLKDVTKVSQSIQLYKTETQCTPEALDHEITYTGKVTNLEYKDSATAIMTLTITSLMVKVIAESSSRPQIFIKGKMIPLGTTVDCLKNECMLNNQRLHKQYNQLTLRVDPDSSVREWTRLSEEGCSDGTGVVVTIIIIVLLLVAAAAVLLWRSRTASTKSSLTSSLRSEERKALPI